MKEDNFILIGKVVSAVGIKGEVKVYTYSDNWDNYKQDNSVYIGDDKNIDLIKIESLRIQKGLPIIKFEKVADRTQAEKLVSFNLFVDMDNLDELPEGTYYIRDLIGCEVHDLNEGPIGKIEDVSQNAAQDLYKIRTKTGKEIYVPAVKEFVKKIDMETRIINIELITGFME